MSDLVNMGELAGHVSDGCSYHLPEFLGIHLELPNIFGLQITRFMVVELLTAVILVACFVPLSEKIKKNKPVHGRFWNFLEVLLLYLRNNVIIPSIGNKEVANRFTPFLWTLFFFVLLCNLAGLVPWFGASPTGALATTAVLAASTFLVLVCSGMKKFGVV